MKCIVLAGGRGDRLWPLSRKNYPKQFISLDGSHSIFQDTIARNMAYCDEFVVVTNREYQFIVENQLKAFQGLTWRKKRVRRQQQFCWHVWNFHFQSLFLLYHPII